MKNYELPNMTQIQAYKAGTLSLSEKAEFEVLMNKNPFVKEVVRSFSEENVASIQRISKRVSYKVQEKIITSKGFWSNYGVWIGLSSIALLIGTVWYFSTTAEQQQISSTENLNDVASSDNNTPQFALIIADDVTEEEKNETITSLSEEETTAKVIADIEPSETLPTPFKEKEVHKPVNQSNELTERSQDGTQLAKKSKIEHLEKPNETEKQPLEPEELNSKNKVKATEHKNELKQPASTSFTLAVKTVNLIAKENPRDQVVRKKSAKGDNILARDNVKQQKGSSYSIDDLPSYPGGDQALFNYFKGKLHPQTVSLEKDTFDKSVMLVLEINARGKLTHHEIFGVLHPKHQEALEKAIEELPKFNPGKGEKVVYSIGITF